MCSLQLAIPLEQASASNGPSQLPLGLHIPAAPLHLPPAPALQKLAPAPLNLPPAPAPQKLAPAPLNLSVAGPSPACAPKWAPFSTPQQMHKDTKPWMHNATLLLISLTKQMAEGFQSPVLKKVEMWKKVDAQMLAKGYDFGAEACDNKFRQLKHRYKTIVDSKKKTGSGTSSWVFFSSMEDLLADDPSVEPVLIVSSFAGSSSDPVGPGPSTSQSSTSQPSSSQPSSSQPKPSAEHGKKRRRMSEASEWFDQYVTEQRRQMSELMALQKQAVEVASERNNILK
ncbi:uncharacterized protein [Sinocyclocheilus grahami]|uniref:uncharacterized protein isoform X1 n=1 Tax=Sinocyclocheilus grahami TaxID=75366 RepID=UPI0007ACCAEA|nr:PREDICTED: uncharacterized protein LOC107557165 isoform X1 [Sinocyclocheilus grahami]